jgi:hypothetical protein
MVLEEEHEFDKAELVRQDFVDNCIQNMIAELSHPHPPKWDMETISEIRNTVIEFLKKNDPNFNKYEFYPYIK